MSSVAVSACLSVTDVSRVAGFLITVARLKTQSTICRMSYMWHYTPEVSFCFSNAAAASDDIAASVSVAYLAISNLFQLCCCDYKAFNRRGLSDRTVLVSAMWRVPLVTTELLPLQSRALVDNRGPVSAVHQDYQTEVHNVYTISGNAAVFSCEVPSYVSEFVTVREWQTAAGPVFRPGRQYGNSPDMPHLT